MKITASHITDQHIKKLLGHPNLGKVFPGLKAEAGRLYKRKRRGCCGKPNRRIYLHPVRQKVLNMSDKQQAQAVSMMGLNS